MTLKLFAFLLFVIGTIVFYFLIFNTFKYTKSQGYKIVHPFPELFKFLHLCSKIEKETNDNNLKFLLFSINIIFCFCVIVFLSIAFLI